MEERSIDTLPLDGGWLCLNFINTVHDRTAEEPFEYLSSYNDLLDWSVKLELLSTSEHEVLKKTTQNIPDKADELLHEILEVREVLYGFFEAIAQNRPPEEHLQSAFNQLLGEAMSHLTLQVIGEDLSVHQKWINKSELEYPLHPILKSAYDLLVSGKLDRVKECGACGWLFLDQSKNRSRKWCSMENCGSNVKAKRYYHRNKKKMDE